MMALCNISFFSFRIPSEDLLDIAINQTMMLMTA